MYKVEVYMMKEINMSKTSKLKKAHDEYKLASNLNIGDKVVICGTLEGTLGKYALVRYSVSGATEYVPINEPIKYSELVGRASNDESRA